ncbi:hypothetical protein MSAN_02422800 [Mycena sanguinolenta]|uniref:Uncharacterized protein n=1 Tax=Mycena sanguinolenta TaxID=230812 RepID=A0A8H7CE89_9AGAR|nr:hypothetical protein MSAN_02422800 [Mycena sanguinolenta]
MDAVPTLQPLQGDTGELFKLSHSENTSLGFLCDDVWDELLSVPSSQPFEDGEDFFMISTAISCALTPPRMLTKVERRNSLQHSSFSSCVGDDSGPMEISAEISSRRARLVRRAPRVIPDSKPVFASNPPRRLNLFLKALELEKKRERARQAARRINEKIRVLTKATARLHREQRHLRALAAAHKENMFSVE